MSTTSGRSSTSARADGDVVGLADHVETVGATSAARTPSRNSGWSSTSSTRVIAVPPRSPGGSARSSVPRPGSGRAGTVSDPPISSARCRIDAMPRPEPGAVPRPVASGPTPSSPTTSVSACRRSGEGQAEPGRVGVPRDVGERLGRDPVRRDLRGRAELAPSSTATSTASPGVRCRSAALQGPGQPEVVDARRPEPVARWCGPRRRRA